jgi:hypothetical protein
MPESKLPKKRRHMPAENSLDQQIIEKLNSLPRVTLSAEAKQAQLGVVMSRIATGAAVMISIPLYRLLFSRIKEALSKYLLFSTLVSLAILAVLTYLVYPQTGPKPPFNEKPVLTQQPKKKTKAKTERDQRKLAVENTDQGEQPEEPSQVLSYGQEEPEEEIAAELPIPGTAGQVIEPTPGSSETPGPQEPSGEKPTEPPTAPSQQPPKCALHIISSPPFRVGHAIRFAAECSDDDGRIVRVVWDFGDGGSLEIGPEISLVDHIYTTAGNYGVTLTVVDNDGNSAKATKTVTITAENQPPVAQFSDNAPKKEGQPVKFNNKSYDPDGFIAQFSWEFGDGSTSSEKSPTHVYQKCGTYQVKLTVIDNQGGGSSVSKEITIRDDPKRGCHH